MNVKEFGIGTDVADDGHPVPAETGGVEVTMAGISAALRERLAVEIDSIAERVFAEGGGLAAGSEATAGDYRSAAAKMISTALLAGLSDTSAHPVSPVILREVAAHFSRLGVPLRLLLDRVDLTQTIALRAWWPLVEDDQVLDMLSFSALLADTIADIKRHLTKGYRLVGVDYDGLASARAEVADRLLAGEPPDVTDVLRTGVWIASSYVVLSTPWPEPLRGEADVEAINAMCADHEVLWARRFDTLLLLVPGGLRDRSETAVTSHLKSLCGRLPVLGRSTEHDSSCVPTAMSESTDALHIALLCGMAGTVRYESIAIERALWHDAEARGDLLAVVDELNGDDDLLRTLDAFYRCDMDRKRTATELGLARSSLTGRLRRIEQLTGLPPTSARGGTVLSAAITAHHMERAFRQEAV